ncbi:hypothetical protein JCM10207_007492 [Rhodosporidiobolus poonsookiae]
MPLPPLTSTSPLDWRYTAEGGANLVLSFAGPSDSPYTGRALRLRKCKRRTAVDERPHENEVPAHVDVEFGRRVIEPLLGHAQVVDTEKVPLDKRWLQGVVDGLREEGARPAEREKEDEIDLDAAEGVVAEDLVGGKGVLAIEIKPKWGFLPSPTFLSPSTRDIKTSFCRFCMHRYHKRTPSASDCAATAASLAEHEAGFCPLDLYSGDAERLKCAVEALYQGWTASSGEANNLRIFLGGERLSPPDGTTESSVQLGHLVLTLQHLGLSLSPPIPPQPPCHTASPAFPVSSLLADVLVPALLASPLLATLSRLQATLDALDVEGLGALISRETGGAVDLPSASADDLAVLGGQPSLEEWTAWLERYLPLLQPPPPPPSSTLTAPDSRQVMLDALASSPTTLRDSTLAYLLSATFKDCSLIVRFPPPSPDFSSAASSVDVSVKAIDLDPKPIIRLGKYARMDSAIVEGWKALLEGLSVEERGKVRRCRV